MTNQQKRRKYSNYGLIYETVSLLLNFKHTIMYSSEDLELFR